ncbi:MAG: zf-HC2 domain-containing protein [Candidatus Eisenbacteria bacterium]|nr:zf-HC2 domain-containing protein [Candidatus Eisenbacteria bacterium]
MLIPSCRQVVERASDFLERRLRLRERIGVLVHLAMCPGCKAYVEQLRLTIAGLRSLTPAGDAGPAREALLRQFREETRRKPGGTSPPA